MSSAPCQETRAQGRGEGQEACQEGQGCTKKTHATVLLLLKTPQTQPYAREALRRQHVVDQGKYRISRQLSEDRLMSYASKRGTSSFDSPLNLTYFF